MIFVFKTSVKTTTEVRQLKPQINNLTGAEKWNFDLLDADNILRIDSKENIVQKITAQLHLHNFYCEELK